MARRKGTSRVTGSSGPTGPGQPAASPGLPSLRKRKPVLYWGMVAAVGSLVLTAVGSFITAFT